MQHFSMMPSNVARLIDPTWSIAGRDREEIEAAIAAAIDYLDTLDGDPDREDDDPDGSVDDEGEETSAEDEFFVHPPLIGGAGCSCSDPGEHPLMGLGHAA